MVQADMDETCLHLSCGVTDRDAHQGYESSFPGIESPGDRHTCPCVNDGNSGLTLSQKTPSSLLPTFPLDSQEWLRSQVRINPCPDGGPSCPCLAR